MPNMLTRPALLGIAIALLAACKPATPPEAATAEPAAQPAEAAPTTEAAEGAEMAAQMQGSSMAMVAQVGGAMHAAAELCDQADAAALDQARQGQKQAFVGSGGSAEDFEAAYDNGYQDTRAKLDAASGAEREQACRELRQMSAMQP